MTRKEIHNTIDELYKEVEYEELYDGFSSEFCWELGEDIYNIMLEDVARVFVTIDPQRQPTLCNYPVLVNKWDKEVIRLWKGVRYENRRR